MRSTGTAGVMDSGPAAVRCSPSGGPRVRVKSEARTLEPTGPAGDAGDLSCNSRPVHTALTRCNHHQHGCSGIRVGLHASLLKSWWTEGRCPSR